MLKFNNPRHLLRFPRLLAPPGNTQLDQNYMRLAQELKGPPAKRPPEGSLSLLQELGNKTVNIEFPIGKKTKKASATAKELPNQKMDNSSKAELMFAKRQHLQMFRKGARARMKKYSAERQQFISQRSQSMSQRSHCKPLLNSGAADLHDNQTTSSKMCLQSIKNQGLRKRTSCRLLTSRQKVTSWDSPAKLNSSSSSDTVLQLCVKEILESRQKMH